MRAASSSDFHPLRARAAGQEKLQRDTGSAIVVEGKERKQEDRDIATAQKERDWNNIPVGLPFTEMITKSKNFTETHLKTETQSVRHTEMQPKQVRS
jgi:hypothetical protein